MANFNTSIDFTGVDVSIKRLLFTDTSNEVNTTPSHDVFGYRKAVVTFPSGLTYNMSSYIPENPDDVIDILSGSSTDNLYIDMSSSEAIDGIYTVQLYNFPLFDITDAYNVMYDTIVWYNGKLYLNILSTTAGILPTNTTYWQEYTISNATDLTRYGVTAKIVVTGFSIDACLKDALYKVVQDTTPCIGKNDRLDNELVKAYKMKLTYDALAILAQENDWTSVSEGLVLLQNSCACGC
jgi:hypothetical protein